MKTFASENGQVTKHVHADGSETCIKTVPSLDTKPADGGEIEVTAIDRNKYSVFASASRGCPMSCSFCYLTIDKMPFGKIAPRVVLNNLMEAVSKRAELEPAIRNRYLKLCWMGMGEPILDMGTVLDVTQDLLHWAITEQRYAQGLDGVDLSTVLPRLHDNEWSEPMRWLNGELGGYQYRLNPNNRMASNLGPDSSFTMYERRSVFRLFYSLHSAIQSSRDRIIPRAMPISEALPQLQELSMDGDDPVDVIVHHMFMEGLNDTEKELDALVWFMAHLPESELRILRYNKHEDSSIRESDGFKECMCYIADKIPKIKVQISQGLDVRSACGQFAYNNEFRMDERELVLTAGDASPKLKE